MNNVTEKTRQLVDAWIAANRRHNAKVIQLAEATKEANDAIATLARWLVAPDFSNTGEWFNIWFGDGILRARRHGDKWECEWKKAPGSKMASEIG